MRVLDVGEILVSLDFIIILFRSVREKKIELQPDAFLWGQPKKKEL